MNWNEFRKWAHKIADWGTDYRENLRDRPVRARTKPGDILKSLPLAPPENAEPMEKIFADFDNKIMPGMTHWQHPRFFRLFHLQRSPTSGVGRISYQRCRGPMHVVANIARSNRA